MIIFIIFFCIINLCSSYFPGGCASGNTYYIDPDNGTDAASGDLSHPWKTIRNGITQLQSGDTLYLRNGVYYESQIVINIQGTDSNRITIKNYPNEAPVIDGGYGEFRTIPNSHWELHDSVKNIYRSVNTYSKATDVYGFFGNENGNYRLVSYKRYEDLSADNENVTDAGGIYIGSGIFWNCLDRKIYVRLQRSRQEVSMGYTVPSKADPHSTELYIFPGHEIITFGEKCAYINIEGVALRYQNNALEYSPGSHHIVIKNSTIKGGRTPIIIRDGAHHLTFDSLKIEGHIPPWIAFSDVKINTKAGHSFQGPAINIQGSANNVEVMNCAIENTWDGIDVPHQSFNLHIHDNVFSGVRDDVIQLGSGCYEVEINDNKMIFVSKGISRHGSGSPLKPGTKYIHHNVIDCSKSMLGGRNDPENLLKGKYRGPNNDGMVWARPFGSHEGKGYGDGDPWKIYNNTIIFGKELNEHGAGHEYTLQYFYRACPQEVYNNIFIQTMDHWLARGSRLDDGSQIYDGNIYFRTITNGRNCFFRDWGRKGKGNSKDFKNLAEFKSSQYFHITQRYYSPGWENSGTEANPLLDDKYRPDPNGPAAKGAIPLPKSWPSRARGKYRGALPPKES